MRVPENIMLRIFGPKIDEIIGGWKKLLHNLYSSTNIIIRVIKSGMMRWAEYVTCMRENTSAYTVLAGKPEGRRLLGRPKSRWEDNIKIYLQETG
jgi:hypothetical protein